MYYGKQDVFVNVSGYFSKSTIAKLKQISLDRKVPMSILINRAVENELLASNSFNRDLSLPENVDEKDVDYEDSNKLFMYVKKNPGLSLEHLIILHNDIGIDAIDKLKAAYVYLLSINILVESKPINSKFDHPPTYKTVKPARVKIQKPETVKKIKTEKSVLDSLEWEDEIK